MLNYVSTRFRDVWLYNMEFRAAVASAVAADPSAVAGRRWIGKAAAPRHSAASTRFSHLSPLRFFPQVVVVDHMHHPSTLGVPHGDLDPTLASSPRGDSWGSSSVPPGLPPLLLSAAAAIRGGGGGQWRLHTTGVAAFSSSPFLLPSLSLPPSSSFPPQHHQPRGRLLWSSMAACPPCAASTLFPVRGLPPPRSSPLLLVRETLDLDHQGRRSCRGGPEFWAGHDASPPPAVAPRHLRSLPHHRHPRHVVSCIGRSFLLRH
jgi:hypothetical protein